MQTVGTPVGQPVPRRVRRRRLSRRRLIRRLVGGALFAVILAVGFVPVMRSLGYLSRDGGRKAVQQWEVVRLSADRRWVQIRVDECGAKYEGAHVAKVGRNVRLTVFERNLDEHGATLDCVPFERMPTHVVMLGFMLPKGGRVLSAG